jgi:hypothetical protein
MTRHSKTAMRFWFALFCLVPMLGIGPSSATAQAKKPQGADLLPREKKMCQEDKRL